VDSKPIYQFNQFILEPKSQSLFYREDEIKLEPRIFEVLHLMLQRPHEVITKEEFFEHVWEEKVVSDWALSRAIKEVRKKLNTYQDLEWVKTIYGKGYLFTQDVEIVDEKEFKSSISRSKQSLEHGDNQSQELASSASLQSESNNSKAINAPGGNNLSDLTQNGLQTSESSVISRLAIKLLFVVTLLIIVAVASFWGARKAEPNESRISSIVVLPISNLAATDELNYLANGLTDVLTGRLAQNKELRVISKTSAVYYQNKNMSPREIASELNIESILEGAFYANGDLLNLNLRLIDANTEELLWSVNEEVPAQDISGLYRIASQKIANRINGEKASSFQASSLPFDEVDQETLELYLKAVYLFKQRRRSTLLEAQELLLKCIERAPNFAEGYAALAAVYIKLVGYSANDSIDRYTLAQQAVSRALEIKPESSNAWAHQGLIAFGRDYDFKTAEQAYQKAIALDPSNTSAKQWYAELLSITSRDDEALAILEDAWADDPFNRLLITIWGSTLLIKGEYQQALEKFDLAKSLGDKIIWVDREVAYVYGWLGNREMELQSRLEQMKNSGYSQEKLAELNALVNEQGIKGYWKWRIQQFLPRWEVRQLNATRLSEAYAGAGDYQNMMVYLKEAIAQQSDYWLQVVKRSPEFYRYRDRAEFKAILSEYGISIEKP
jgi:DNA-binding winged helix-turn-helix (wHTH) protein/TolB-like protein